MMVKCSGLKSLYKRRFKGSEYHHDAAILLEKQTIFHCAIQVDGYLCQPTDIQL
jgi:hypothetical protein